MQSEDYRALLSRVFAGQRVIVAVDVLAGATPMARDLQALGAERCLCVATSLGVGPTPDPEFAPDPVLVEIDAPDMMTGIRRSLEVFANLPAWAVERIDAFDPEKKARVIGSTFDDGRPVGGRRKYGARAPEWRALEDKTVVDAFWDGADVARAPARVVPASRDALEAARTELDAGAGVVFSGDSRDGVNGGATYVRWVRSPEQTDEVAPFFHANCDRVRVMPFLEGIPCSIHGFVFPTAIVTLRPCEMLVFQRPGSTLLHYGRAGSFWDPAPEVREQMREVARKTGERLREGYGYRGAFTVDGVLTREGFLPTELNPRFGAALSIMTAKLDIPLLLLNAAVVEGEDLDWQPEELERLILEVADRERSGGGMAMTERKETENRKADLVWTGAAFRIAAKGETADATAMLGPSSVGGFLKVELVPDRTPVGPSAAPRVALALACADAHWDLGIGTLEPAREAS
jgi:hypothetical protein